MSLKRVATLPVLAGILVLGLSAAAPASAQDYGGNCVLQASGTGVPGSDVTVSGSGFEPNLQTELVFTDDDSSEVLGPISVEGDGTFGPLTFELPGTITGDTFTLSAVCNAELDRAEEVLGTGQPRGAGSPRGSGPSRISRTGSDTVSLLVAGGVTLVVGTGVLLVARRRRMAAAA